MISSSELSAAERAVVRGFPRGVEVVLRGEVVRASVLRDVLLGGARPPGEVPALRVSGARVTGVLDLANAIIDCPVRLRDCRFDSPPDLHAARTRQVNLTGSSFPGMRAAGVRMDGALHLTGCRSTGEIRLAGARIGGALLMEDAHLESGTGEVLLLDPAHIDNDLWAPGLRAYGRIRLAGAELGGALNLEDAVLDDPGGLALHGGNLTVGSGVMGSRLRTTGEVRFTGARVAGRVELGGAELGGALNADGCVAAELSLRGAAPVGGAVTLRRARVGLLGVEPGTWPDEVGLDGLTYDGLAPHLPAKDRLPVLDRDGEGYVPHAYEQLAAAYTRIGDDDSARTVRLAKQRRHRRTLPWYGRAWGYLQDVAVGYGYRPMRAASWLVALLVAGTVAFGLHHPPPLEAGKAPAFNPLVYTLDLLIPIADFGQAGAYDPRGAYQWLSYLLVVAGWLLATTVLAGVTRAINRS